MATRELTRRGDWLPSVFDDFFKPWNAWFDNSKSWNKGRATIPSINIEESKTGYKMTMAAPGLQKSAFKIDVDGNMLTISSEKEEGDEEKNARYTRKEYNYCSFSRSFTLPEDVKQDAIEASYENGVLKLVIPKKETSQKLSETKHIAVT